METLCKIYTVLSFIGIILIPIYLYFLIRAGVRTYFLCKNIRTIQKRLDESEAGK